MKVALCQLCIRWEDKKENIKRAEGFIKDAAKNGADMILFPEMSFTGFSMNISRTMEKDNETKNRMMKLACQNHIAVGFGWVKEAGERAENHYTVAGRDGTEYGDYIKIHSFTYGGEREQFVPGKQIVSFCYEGFRFVPFVCYDLRFPELFRIVSEEPVVFMIPANWPVERKEHWICLLKARAIENQSFVLGINCVGEAGGKLYEGNSQIIGPEGKILAMLSGKEGIIYADLDKEEFEVRESFPVQKDRRTELYIYLREAYNRRK